MKPKRKRNPWPPRGSPSPGTTETETSQDQKEQEIVREQPEWDTKLREHRDEIVREQELRTENTEDETDREQSWELYRLCKSYLEENSEAWRTRKVQREHERNRQERLEKAGLLRRKTQIEYIENNIKKGIEKLTPADRERLRIEDQRKQQIEIENAKKDLWKFRGKEKKHKNENVNSKIQELGKRAELVATLHKQEKERTSMEKIINEKKETAKRTREQKRKEKIEQERKIEEHWAMFRWTTEYIEKNMKYWEYRRKTREQERQKMLDEWDKKNRIEKIRTLKEKYAVRTTVEKKETENNKDYENWREQKQNKEECTRNNDSRENNDQKTTTELPVFPIFKKLKKATEIKSPKNKENELVIGKHNNSPPKTTTSKQTIKKTTEIPKTTVKHNKITKYMKRQTQDQKETTPKNDTNKPKPKNKTDKTTTRNRKQQQQKENETKKLRGYWVNLAIKNKNQVSKVVQSDVNQPSLSSSSCSVQSCSQIQVEYEPQMRGGLHAPKECSRMKKLAAPILESED